MTLLAAEANLAATAEAAMKQATSATETAQRLLSDKDSENENKENENAVKKLEAELAAAKKGKGLLSNLLGYCKLF